MFEGGEVPQNQVATETALPAEAITKYDQDLVTISKLQDYANRQKRTMLLSGGLAVEAHCGGRITRPHGDIDVSMTFQTPEINAAREELTSLLSGEGTTNWILFAADERKIEFRENDSNKPFKDRRRVEILVRDRIPDTQTQQRKLIDSTGKEYIVTVDHIAELVAHKLRIFNREQGKVQVEKTKRATNPNDKTDIRRLIALPDFDKEECLKRLAEYYLYKGESNTEEDALAKANKEWDDAMTSINLL